MIVHIPSTSAVQLDKSMSVKSIDICAAMSSQARTRKRVTRPAPDPEASHAPDIHQNGHSEVTQVIADQDILAMSSHGIRADVAGHEGSRDTVVPHDRLERPMQGVGQHRPESTGLLPAIPEPQGMHVRFLDSSDEACEPVLEDSEVIAQLHFDTDEAGRPLIRVPRAAVDNLDMSDSAPEDVPAGSLQNARQLPYPQRRQEEHTKPQKRWYEHASHGTGYKTDS
jgi:hypothetical protein